jgi:hypothetical protein
MPCSSNNFIELPYPHSTALVDVFPSNWGPAKASSMVMPETNMRILRGFPDAATGKKII